MLLLFPISEKSEEHRRSESEQTQSVDPKLYYMKQVVGNACGNNKILYSDVNSTYIFIVYGISLFQHLGTIGILHAVMNSLHRGLSLRPNSFIERMARETTSLNADERADWLGRDEEVI